MSGKTNAWRWMGPTLITLMGGLILAEMFFRIFSVFQSYDDMGYIMMSLKKYQQGHALYDEVFTQYGPFYYLLRDLMYGGIAITHDLTGAVSVVHAWICALVLAVVTHRLTGSTLCSLLVLTLVPGRVAAFANEPGHPQELVCLLAVLLVFAASWKRWPLVRSCIVGILVGAMVMTKVNVGVFAFLAAFYWFACAAGRGAWRRLFVVLFTVGTAALPFVLMRKHLDVPWGLSLAFVLAVSLVPLVIFIRPATSNHGWRELLAFAASFCVAILLIPLHQMMRGTSPQGLWNGLIAGPVNFSTVFAVPFPIGYRHAMWALFAILAIFWSWRRLSPKSSVIAGTIYAGGLCALMLRPTTYFAVRFFAPYLWLDPFCRARSISSAAPAGHQALNDPVAIAKPSRSALPSPDTLVPNTTDFYGLLLLLAGFLLLQSYPVAGSQVACSLIFFPVIAAVGLYESWTRLSSWRGWWDSRTLQFRAVGLLVAALFCWKGFTVWQLAREYGRNERTGLRGMTLFRLPAQQSATLRWATESLQPYDTFVTMPGLYSFYFWAAKEPPTAANATAWMILLDDAQQQRVVDSLAGYGRLGGVRMRRYVDFWVQRAQDISQKPLVRFMEQKMKVVANRDGIELLEAAKP